MAKEIDSNTTMETIARLAGVSKPTVSRVLNNYPHVAEKTRKKVLKAASEYGYSINRQAQRLRAKHSNAIAVMLDFPSFGEGNVSDPFIFDLLSNISHVLTEREQDLLLVSPPAEDSVAFYQSLIASKSADGIIFLGRGFREHLLKQLSKTKVPFVVWGTSLEDTPFCCIGSDGFSGGKQAGQYLIEKGRRNILFIGNTRHREIHARRAGLQEASNESPHEIIVRDLLTNNLSEKLMFKLANDLARSEALPPDALFAYSDTAAMAFISAFKRVGLSAPKDFNVVGYNNISLSEYFNPGLTTINQDSQEASRLLVEKLEQAIQGEKPTSVTLTSKLINRGS